MQISPGMMRALIKLVLMAAMLLAAGSAMAQAAWTKLERVELFGNEYVRLRDWAKTYKFSVQTLRPDGSFTVSTKWSKMLFKVDSRQAQINGVSVHLSVPIARRGNETYIAPIDLRTAVHPILFPAKLAAGKRVTTICIDPGHGGKDPGNQEGRRFEKDYTFLYAKELKRQLEEAKFKVVMTRTNDSYVSLEDRPEIARKHKADLFISIHFNAVDDSSVRGVENYCMTPAYASSTNARGEGANTGAFDSNGNDALNVQLAWQVQKSLVSAGAVDRGVRRARFAVLKLADMPAILLEACFMTNPADGPTIYDPETRLKAIKAVVSGIRAYKRAVEK